MGIFGKIALGVVKEAASFVALDIMEGNNDTFNQAVESLEKKHAEKLNTTAAGRIIITLDSFTLLDTDVSNSVVRNIYGDVLYHVTKKHDGKTYIIYNASKKIIAEVKCTDAWFANVNRYQKFNGHVKLKLSLKGTYHEVSWNKWRIDSNLVGDKRTISLGDKQIAETKYVFLGKEQYIMYINDENDIESVLLSRFAADAINAYRTELAEEQSEKDNRRSRKQNNKEKTHPSKVRASEKQTAKKTKEKSFWAKLRDDNEPISFFDDDDWDN